MDKKNTIIGAFLLVAAFALLYFGPKPATPSPRAPQVHNPATGDPTTRGNQAPGPAVSSLPASGPSDATFASLSEENQSAKVITLANDFVEAHFTDFGGALRDVAFKKYPAVKGRPEAYIFNQVHAEPMLAFTKDSYPGLDSSTRYELISQTPSEVVFRAVLNNDVEVLRRYSLPQAGGNDSKSDPYRIRHDITFRNLTDKTTPLARAALSLGTTTLLGAHDNGLYLSIGYNNGKDIEFVQGAKLEGRGFLGMGGTGPVASLDNQGPILWASATNQFFTSILTPDQPGVSVVTRRIELPPSAELEHSTVGLTGALRLDLPTLAPRGEAKVGMEFYVGPKEYKRLSNSEVFKQDEDKVMKFGFFKFFSQMLITMMTWVHGWTGNWGAAIIITTLLIKIGSLPFTLRAAKTSKRMQKLQPEMKALNEKYKDNPQKRSQALMELYKARGVNPLGGCFPMLIPLPFFFGFFSILQTASELRFAEFAWVRDLMAPDTVARIGSLPFIGSLNINILPILLGVTMIVQMRLVPQPAMDNEQSQMMAKMMKFMPLFYVAWAYNISCAISLYSTMNGLFTIGQQLFINRMKDPEVVSAAVDEVVGKLTKNVTPSKKKVR